MGGCRMIEVLKSQMQKTDYMKQILAIQMQACCDRRKYPFEEEQTISQFIGIYRHWRAVGM